MTRDQTARSLTTGEIVVVAVVVWVSILSAAAVVGLAMRSSDQHAEAAEQQQAAKDECSTSCGTQKSVVAFDVCWCWVQDDTMVRAPLLPLP